MNKEYIERLQMTVEHLHGCRAKHEGSETVHEVFQGQTVWQGTVEKFQITGHPKATRCYGWSHAHGKDDSGEMFVTVLELPPVTDALTAVRAAIMSEVKAKRGKQ